MKKYVAVGIVFLFIITSATPMVIGYKSDEYVSSESEELLDNLAFMCYDEYGSNAKYEYYKEQFIKEYSNDEVEIVEPVEKMISGGLPLPFTTGPMDSAWPMKCHDNRHTSQSPHSTADNPFDEIWRFRCDMVEGGPVIGEDGTIYFGDHDDYLYAVNPDGTEKWRYKTGMWIWSAPALDEDGTVYVGSYDSWLYAVNPDGTLKWSIGTGGSISSSPAIGIDGTIYVGTMGPGNYGRICAINPNGTEKWHYNTGYWITSDPAIGDDGTIYIGSGDDYFYAMNPNGTLKWRFKTGSYIKGPASIADDGTIYVGSWDDYLYALNPNGTMKWRHHIDAGTESNPSIGSDGTIYCGGSYLYAINPDGTRKWTFDFGENKHSHQSSPAISADGTIFIGTVYIDSPSSDGGEIVAVNPDGTEKWRKWIATYEVQSSPCISEDGTVYIGSSSFVEGKAYSYGYLYAFNGLNPDAPAAPTITGETTGVAGEEYEYTFCTTDPNGDDVTYYIEWGYTEDTELVGPYSSGEEITLSYSWSEEERPYIIISRAKDTDGHWGPYGELKVTMPINQHSNSFPLLQRLLEWFPNLFPILRNLLEL